MELWLGFLRVSFPTALSHILMYLRNYLSILEERNGNLSHALLSFCLFANITMKETRFSGSLQCALISVLHQAAELWLPLWSGQIKAIKDMYSAYTIDN